MKSTKTNQPPSGFTLIELLVATAVLGISMITILGIYTSVLSVVEEVDHNTSVQNHSALLIDQLERDLGGIYKGRSGFFRAAGEAAANDDITLFEFTTTSQLRFKETAPAVRLAVVRYGLKKSGNDNRYTLYRFEFPLFYGNKGLDDAGVFGIPVAERIGGFRLGFMDRYGTMVERWEARSGGMENGADDDRFPRLLRIELEMRDEAGDKATSETWSHVLAIPVSRFSSKIVEEQS